MPRLDRTLSATAARLGASIGHNATSSSPSWLGPIGWLDDLLRLPIHGAIYDSVGIDKHDDLAAFVSVAITHLVSATCMFTAFSVLRKRFPLVFQHNVVLGSVPFKPAETFAGWAKASMSLGLDQVDETAGLDAAMTLEFMNVGIRMMLIVGAPLCLVLMPVNWYFGDGHAGVDHIGWVCLRNAAPGGMLDWAHAVVVWLVVIFVPSAMYSARETFLRHRYAWLKRLPAIRANTVMVSNIPEEFQSDKKLGDFFGTILSGRDVVKTAYVVRNTASLHSLWDRLVEAREQLSQAEATWKVNQEAGLDRPTVGLECCGQRNKVDAIEHFSALVAELEPQVLAERETVLANAAADAKGAYWGTGFVTFYRPLHREIVVRLNKLHRIQSAMTTSEAPEPKDVMWSNLAQDPKRVEASCWVGYFFLAALLFAYTPLVIGITNIANSIKLGPYLQPFWSGVAPSLGVTIMIGFLPTFLNIIITTFFPQKATTSAQLELQFWYFWFLVFLVLIATCIGQDMIGFARTLVKSPLLVIEQIAITLPDSTNFYLNLLVCEWSDDACQMLRGAPLFKYLVFSKIYNEEKAKEMAEPEDQDYNGIGARSARMTITVAIGLAFGTLSPPIWMVCLCSLMVKRVVFGYLLVFAETRKPDLGGAFWVTQLHGVYVALIMFSILMTAVLVQRSGLGGPGLVVLPSILYVLRDKRQFEAGFSWESLPVSDVADTESAHSELKSDIHGQYLQPELQPK